MLHLTNGDAPVPAMKAAGLNGEILPWRDILHEGPVASCATLEDLSDIRAQFLSETGYEFDDIRREFSARDALLSRFHEFDEVVLWFEHDLYDQLQLIQILDWLSRRDRNNTVLSIVNVAEYLGPTKPERFRQLFEERLTVGSAQLELGRRAWGAFTADDPRALESIAGQDTSALPFLSQAFRRFLQQYPSVENGLSRSEHQALKVVADGRTVVKDAYVASHHEIEEPIFLGDYTFAMYLAGLSDGPEPLVTLKGGSRIQSQAKFNSEFWNAELELTEVGKEIVEKRADWIKINGIDRWYGGVHQKGPEARWRWNEKMGRIDEQKDGQNV